MAQSETDLYEQFAKLGTGPAEGTILRLPPDKLLGQVVGRRYEVISLLGSGARGKVYKVRHCEINTEMAMKVLHSYLTEQEQLDRFQHEAALLMQLGHPNICRVFDYTITNDGQPCILMEYLCGETLEQLLQRERQLPVSDALGIVEQVCEGLRVAHEANVIHRDIKPANVMIERSGGTLKIKLVDFGLARQTDQDSSFTETGKVLGSPPYMSPEQCRGLPLDARADIYSTGCVLYEMISGIKPFGGDTVAASFHKQLTYTPPPIELDNSEKAANSLQLIVDQMLEKDVQHRYRSVREILDDVNNYRNDRPIAPRTRSKTRRDYVTRTTSGTSLFRWQCAAACVAALLVIDFAFFLFNSMSTTQSPVPARPQPIPPGPVVLDPVDPMSKEVGDLLAEFRVANKDRQIKILYQLSDLTASVPDGRERSRIIRELNLSLPSAHPEVFRELIDMLCGNTAASGVLLGKGSDAAARLAGDLLDNLLPRVGDVSIRPDQIDAVKKLTLDEDPKIRSLAIQLLTTPATKDATLKECISSALLHDRDTDVRCVAARAAGTILASENLVQRSQILEALQNVVASDAPGRVRLTALSPIQTTAAAARASVPLLIRLLSDSRQSIRRAAEDALGKAGAAAAPALPQLMKLAEPLSPAKNDVIETIGRIGPPAKGAVPLLIRALSIPGMESGAALALSQIGRDAAPAVDALIVLLSNTDSSIRSVAGKALGDIGPAAHKAVPILIETLITQGDDTELMDAVHKLDQPFTLEQLSSERKKRGILTR